MDFENLTPELRARMAACSTPAEMLALAGEENYELTDEELDQVVGGAGMWGPDNRLKCPLCASGDLEPQGMHTYRCQNCHALVNESQLGS